MKENIFFRNGCFDKILHSLIYRSDKKNIVTLGATLPQFVE